MVAEELFLLCLHEIEDEGVGDSDDYTFRREEIYLAKDFVSVRWTSINIGSTQWSTYVGGLFLDRVPVRTYHIGDSFKTILPNISPEEADMLATKIAALLKWHYDGVIGDFSGFSRFLLPRHIRERVKE